MKKIIENSVAEIIRITVFSIAFLSSCGSTKQIQEPVKECCEKTAQAVYEYEGLVVDCENCDEID